MNRNFVTRLSHSEYKNVLLNKKCLRHLVNRVQKNDHKKKKLNNIYDGLALGY